MPTKAYFPRSHRYIDGAARSPSEARRAAGPGPRQPASGRHGVAASGVAQHAPPEDYADAQTGADSDADSDADSGTYLDADSGADSDAYSGARSGADSDAYSGARSGADSGAYSGARSGAYSGARAGAGVRASGERSPRPSSPRALARAPVSPPRAVAVGDWLWACRAGAEPDLCDELQTYGLSGRMLQPGLCASPARPRTPQKEDAELTFARQGLPVQAVGAADVQFLATFISELFADRRQAQRGSGLALHVFAPDSDAGNLLAAVVLELQARLSAALVAAGIPLLPDARTAHAEGGKLAQICLLTADKVAVGVLPARAAPSLVPGGRQRFKKPKDAPARSALKLTEALAWLGHGPQAGEVCVDLGAAPGGWSQVLLERRCHVVAIDPGRMAPHLVGRLEHLRTNAFTFEPEIPADWVLCDMAYRPLEVAGLLAKWGRRRWAQFLLANIKLPMNRRVDMLARVREILATGGWTGLRMRQLYHDRDEVTLTGWRGFGVDTRVQRAAPTDSAAALAPAVSPPSHRPPRARDGAAAKPKTPPGRNGAAAKPKAPSGRNGAATKPKAPPGRSGGAAKPKAPPSRGRRSAPPAPSRKPPRPRR